jgi:Carboxypeptidase regulatory-like domain
VRILRQFLVGMVCVGLGAGGLVCADPPPYGLRRESLAFATGVEQQQQEKAAGGVAGRIVLEGIGAGVRKAVVTLEPAGGENGVRAEAGQPYVTATDTEGRFRFEGVAPGEYRVNWVRTGFLRVGTRPEATLITVAPGQELGGLVYKMQMTGVIAGKITEADGDPMPGTSVWATRVGSKGTEFDTSGREEGEAGQETTNDLGEFRIANLRAGQYIVQAEVHGMDPAPDPAQKGRQRDKSVYALTYYPGTADPRAASPVVVNEGGTATASFEVVTRRSYHVSGTVTVAGNARNVQMFLVSATGQTESQGLGDGGKFEFANILPGTYEAQIVDMEYVSDGKSPESHTQMIGSPIVVSDADVTGLILQPEAAASVKGKVWAEGGVAFDGKGMKVTLVRVTEGAEALAPLEGLGGLGGEADLKEDGTFEFKEVAAGNYQVSLGGPEGTGDYYMKSVTVDGREVVDTGFPMTGEIVLDVVMSAKGASIEGTVVDGDGKNVAGATVVSLPSTGKLGRPDTYRTEKTDSSGHFLMRGMHPGAYVLVAMGTVTDDVRKPEFFQMHAEKGQTVDVDEAERKSVVVKMVEEGN